MSVLNIIELQNVVTSSSGLNPTAYLSNQLMNIQEMVQYDEKRINVNVISNFNTGPIQFVAPVQFTDSITTTTGTLATGATATATTIGTTSTLGLLTVGGATNSLTLIQNSTTPFYITANGDATFSGSVSAQNFITSSDIKRKYSIRPIINYMTILSTITGVHFKWNSTNQADIGIIAQDLQPVLPEAVIETPDGLQVAYMKLIPVLIEAVKNLQERVNTLENSESRGFNSPYLDD